MQKRCFTVVDLLVLVAIVVVLFVVVFTSPWDRWRENGGHGNRCISNLRQIGLALNQYACENKDKFPAIPYDTISSEPSILVGPDVNMGKKLNDGQSPWRNLAKNNIEDPFAEDNQGHYLGPAKTPTVSASLWLLCRSGMATPKCFICPSDLKKTRVEDPLLEIDKDTYSEKYFSDFYVEEAQETGALISYSFLNPYDANWKSTADSKLVIGSDENNGLNPRDRSDNYINANSTNHRGEGQNILRVDASAEFSKSPYVGNNQDNIYTALPNKYGGDPGSFPGLLNTRSGNKQDSVLLPIMEKRLSLWKREIGDK